MGSLTLQWSLDRTTNDLIGVSRGILEAATTDNVQALALLACESFGTCIPMSQESCHKVFLLCSRSHESTVVQFLKAQIGYRKGDSAWQLAQSDAGLRFLGLAACLNTMGLWKAAVALHSLIYESAADKKLIPTAQHLKMLMQALDNKLASSGFADYALGWAAIMFKDSKESEDAEAQALQSGQRIGTMEPPPKAVVGLVQAMARLARVGEEVKKIEVLIPSENGPWFAAFIQWCLGAPPDIIFYDGRTLVSENPSQVTLRLSRTTKKSQEIKVELYDYAGNITEPVRTVGSISEFAGLVGVRTYGQTTLRRFFGHNSDPRYRACVQALPHACAMVRQNLLIRREWSTSKISTEALAEWLDTETTAKKAQIFPPNEDIAQNLHEYLSRESSEAPRNLERARDGFIIEDLSMISMVKSRLLQDCSCRSCRNPSMKVDYNCKYQTFLGNVSICVAHILALSLVTSADQSGVKVRFSPSTDDFGGQFVKSIKSILLGGKSTCSVSDILNLALNLLGHDTRHRIHGWVMSSYYNQTIYPQLFATGAVRGESLLALECVPGTLMLGDQCFSNVNVERLTDQDISDDESDTDRPRSRGQHQEEILEHGRSIHPEDAFPNHNLQWRMVPREYELEVFLLIPNFLTRPTRNPRFALEAAAESIFVDCMHEQMASHTVNASDIHITQPLAPIPQSKDVESVGIVQSNRNEQIRFFTLAMGHPGVIRQSACLECCLKCCRITASRFILC